MYYRFLQNPSTIEPDFFDSSRVDHFAITEPDETTWYYIPLDSEDEVEKVMSANETFIRYEQVNIKDYMDWGVQWSTHCPDFKDYKLQVDLSKYTPTTKELPTLHLNAGPGFGDLSHPTTRLTLEMMSMNVEGKSIIDIGCGSGILTLAAILLGAKHSYGIDIDPEALTHAEENARMNHMENQVTFLLPEDTFAYPKKDCVILMNMIRTQQQQAWASLPQLHDIACDCFTSGILIEEKHLYLEECSQRGWKLVEAKEQGDWMAFHFKS